MANIYNVQYLQCLISTMSNIYNVQYLQCLISTMSNIYNVQYLQCLISTMSNMTILVFGYFAFVRRNKYSAIVLGQGYSAFVL